MDREEDQEKFGDENEERDKDNIEDREEVERHRDWISTIFSSVW